MSMATLLDILYVALFAVAFPLWDYFVFWPAFHRRSKADPAGARRRLCIGAIGYAWPLVAVGAALWFWNGRSWVSFGFSVPDGWRLWSSLALILLLVVYFALAVATLDRSFEQRASLRQQIGKLTAVMPHTRTDLYWFSGVSLSAGFCEEFLFRGYFIWVFAPWMGWWGAAVLSLVFFSIGHLYQGWNGVLRVGIVGGVYTLVVAIIGSLWTAISLHAILDLGQGLIAWIALREREAKGDMMGVEKPTGTQSATAAQ